jgi:hypothetical protein
MFRSQLSRRNALQVGVGLSGIGLSPSFPSPAHAAAGSLAKSCIVIYGWGGVSHYESWDPKPDAPSDLRGEFSPIATATPAMQFCEHIPLLAKHSDKLAIVRSVHHNQSGHQQGMYVSLTGHQPTGGMKAKNANNWPSLAALISRFRKPEEGTPAAIRVPYSMYDNGTLMAGEYGGWLGADYNPILMRTPSGKPYGGVSRYTSRELDLKLYVKPASIVQRQTLRERLERQVGV